MSRRSIQIPLVPHHAVLHCRGRFSRSHCVVLDEGGSLTEHERDVTSTRGVTDPFTRDKLHRLLARAPTSPLPS